MSPPIHRRWLLRSGTLALAGGLAGCNATDGDATDTDATESTAPATTGRPTDGAEGCRVEATLGEVDPIPLTADGRAAGDPETTVEARWNARVQPSMAIESSEFLSYTASRGRVYAVFRLVLANPTDGEVSVSPYDFFGVRIEVCDAEWYAEPPLRTMDVAFENTLALEPGGEREGVLSFEVPRNVDRVTLVRYVDADEEAAETFTATCDRDLAVGVDTA